MFDGDARIGSTPLQSVLVDEDDPAKRSFAYVPWANFDDDAIANYKFPTIYFPSDHPSSLHLLYETLLDSYDPGADKEERFRVLRNILVVDIFTLEPISTRSPELEPPG